MMITLRLNYYLRRKCEGTGDLKLPAVSGSDVKKKKKKSLTSNFTAHNVRARIGLSNQGQNLTQLTQDLNDDKSCESEVRCCHCHIRPKRKLLE
jgi:hypothetical protein